MRITQSWPSQSRALDGEEALQRTVVIDYDVVVLDRDLPRLHGDEVCRTLVARASDAKVLMLTASGTVADRVEGLSIGADDYLPKPFAYAELIARIRALARRSQPRSTPILAHDDLRLDTGQRFATRVGWDDGAGVGDHEESALVLGAGADLDLASGNVVQHGVVDQIAD